MIQFQADAADGSLDPYIKNWLIPLNTTMLYFSNFILMSLAIIFAVVVITVWKMLSDQKYLRQNEFSMILKVMIAVMNCVFSVASICDY